MSLSNLCRILFLLLFSGGIAFARPSDVPLTNWTVPPYRAAGSSGGMTTMTDISPGVGFVAVQPCRIVDTRGGGVFTGEYGPPIMAANAIRPFDLNFSPHCTGIPAGVRAYSLNFTVTETAGPSGDIRAWPTGSPPVQVTSVLNWTVTNAVVANAIIVPAGTKGSIDVQVAGSNTHLLIDINGYFTDQYNPGVSFRAVSTAAGDPAIFALNTGSGSAVIAESANGNGVQGEAMGATGIIFGVVGVSNSSSSNSAGVFGLGEVSPVGASTTGGKAGVRGVSNGFGVVGVSDVSAVAGFLLDGTGGLIASGRIGQAGLTDPPGLAPWSFFGQIGDIGGGGTKSFVEPHPTDPGKNIVYIALEGGEAGTYFRGRGRFQNGLAKIAVPEDFRMVTAPDGLTVQVTPIGAMATVGVMRMDLDEIVVQSSRNVEFSYLVQGFRSAYKDRRPIREGNMYAPESADEKLPALAEELRQRLIRNGTYNADGTANLETARRLGWDKIWERRNPPAPEFAPAAPQPVE